MSQPSISIVTPSFNQGRFIERTLRSVLLQDYPALQYIVIDGGSTDGAADVIEQYRSQLSHAHVGPDNGQSDALAKGFALATGDICAWLNSDDILAPGALRSVAQEFHDHPEIDVIYSHRLAIDQDDRVRYYWLLPEHSNYLMARFDHIPQETTFWRRSLFDRVGGIDPTYRFAMDYDLFARFMGAGANFRRVDRFLGAFRVHPQSKSSTQLDTIGKQEIDRVRQSQRLAVGALSKLVGSLFRNNLNRGSARWVRSMRTLPGALAGVGYDYNRVWNGALRSFADGPSFTVMNKRATPLPSTPVVSHDEMIVTVMPLDSSLQTPFNLPAREADGPSASPRVLQRLSLAISGHQGAGAIRVVLQDWIEFLGGRPAEIVYVDGGSDVDTLRELAALKADGLIDTLELTPKDAWENHRDRCFIQEYRSGVLCTKDLILFAKLDTLPFRKGHEDWLAQDVAALDKADVFAISLPPAQPPLSHWLGTRGEYEASDFVSLCFALMKRSEFTRACREQMGTFIDSSFRGEYPAHIAARPYVIAGLRRALVELLWTEHCRRHKFVALSRFQTPEYQVNHVNLWGPALLPV
ncbi:glycosyltransferase, partial [bacterium]